MVDGDKVGDHGARSSCLRARSVMVVNLEAVLVIHIYTDNEARNAKECTPSKEAVSWQWVTIPTNDDFTHKRHDRGKMYGRFLTWGLLWLSEMKKRAQERPCRRGGITWVSTVSLAQYDHQRRYTMPCAGADRYCFSMDMDTKGQRGS
jgi:hypothetical protein